MEHLLPWVHGDGVPILPELAIEFGCLDSDRSQMPRHRSYELRRGRVHHIERGDLIRLGSEGIGVAGRRLHGRCRTDVGQQERRRHVLGSGCVAAIGGRLFVGLLMVVLLHLMSVLHRMHLMSVLILVLGDGLVEVLQDVRIVLRNMD